MDTSSEAERERLTTILTIDVRASALRAEAAETQEAAAMWRVHAAASALLLAMLVTGHGVIRAALWLTWRAGVLWGRASRDHQSSGFPSQRV
jgi:hypothetical protein